MPGKEQVPGDELLMTVKEITDRVHQPDKAHRRVQRHQRYRQHPHTEVSRIYAHKKVRNIFGCWAARRIDNRLIAQMMIKNAQRYIMRRQPCQQGVIQGKTRSFSRSSGRKMERCRENSNDQEKPREHFPAECDRLPGFLPFLLYPPVVMLLLALASETTKIQQTR